MGTDASKKYDQSSVPKPLQTIISVDFKKTKLCDVLTAISSKADFKINYNRNRLPVDYKISLKMDQLPAIQILLKVLELTGTELIITSDHHVVIVPDKRQSFLNGSVNGRVYDKETRLPLMGTNISFLGTLKGGVSDQGGEFSLKNIEPGNYSLQFKYMGYHTKQVDNLSVDQKTQMSMDVALDPKVIPLQDITISPDQTFLSPRNFSFNPRMSGKEFQVFTFTDDVCQAIAHLPGVASTDFSSNFSIRGGDRDNVLIILDGLELHDPFHQKDFFGGMMSIIDIGTVRKADLLTGGFSPEYGDHTSGVLNVNTLRASSGNKNTSLGVSLLNSKFLSEGSFKDNRGAWLLSVRRGYPDYMLDILDETKETSLTIYDYYGKVEYNLNREHYLSVNLLHTGDRLKYTEKRGDKNETEYKNTYMWTTLKSTLSPRLYVHSLFSYSNIFHNRNGVGINDNKDDLSYTLQDLNKVQIFGLKQNWTGNFSEEWSLKWGVDFQWQSASYDFHAMRRDIEYNEYGKPFSIDDSLSTTIQPSGRKVSGYFSNFIKVLPYVTAELGLRYDFVSYTKDQLFSPRVNVVCALGKRTYLRSGWGYFYQSQDIHHIHVQDGETDYTSPELNRQWILGLEHRFNNGLRLNMEGYYKNLLSIQPDYRNLSNVFEIFPEMRYDRYRLSFNGGSSKGIEVNFNYDQGGRFACQASYGLAYHDEDVETLIYQGKLYPSYNGKFPSKYDQRHTLLFNMQFRPDKKWQFFLSWRFHTGWPYSQRVLTKELSKEGNTIYHDYYDGIYSTNYPAYHSLDLRINRHFYVNQGQLTVYLHIINLYNQSNIRNVNYSFKYYGSNPYLTKDYDYWLKAMPTIGIRWNWNY